VLAAVAYISPARWVVLGHGERRERDRSIVTNRLAIREAFVMSIFDTVPHTIDLLEEAVMIVQAQYRERVSHSEERAAPRELHAGDFDAGDFDSDDFDADAAEIRRMIELSGMIGLECSVLAGD
jgi:hypothetical protein